mgnify:CR=1 FL=1
MSNFYKNVEDLTFVHKQSYLKLKDINNGEHTG